MRRLACAAAVAAGLLVASCRFVPTADIAALANAGAPNGGVFDPDKSVASIWHSKVVPIGGTIIGAFVIGILSDGLVMMSVSSFWQMVIKSMVIIAAVVVDQAQRKRQQRVALQQTAQLT